MIQIKRERYLTMIRPYYELDMIKVITGVRRCGKSVLLSQIKEEIISDGVSPDHIIWINFEDMAFDKIKIHSELNDHVVDLIKDDSKYYIFLDEVQHVRGFEKALASLKATRNVSLFVTGSSSVLLSGKMATLLVGRCVEFRVQPLSYSEMLALLDANGITMEDPFDDYLRFGGFPQRFDYADEELRIRYLKSLLEGIIDRDICTPSSRMDHEKFMIVASYIMSNAGKEFSAKSISEYFIGENSVDLPKTTIYSYIDKMEKACLICRVKRFDIASKRNLKAIEKQYVIDNGLKLAVSGSGSRSLARNLENAVYLELLQRGYSVDIGKTYKGEVDFIARCGLEKCFIQVAYSIADDDVADREFGAFDSVRDPSPKYVLTMDRFNMSREGIKHINILDWMKGKVVLNTA